VFAPRFLLVLALALLALPAVAEDLTVGWIGREPAIPYVWGSTNPAVEGWPAAGSTVTWRAHVRGWVSAPRTVGYRWTVDGVPVASGTVTVADGTTTVDLPRPWSFARHRIEFEIDTANTFAEESEQNNGLEVFSDGLAVGFWVEQSFYDFFRANQAKLGVGSTSFEDWAQRTVAFFNDMSALAVYPETPDGVLDRWRLQKIVVVPDGALPLNGLPDDASPGATGATHPDKDDQTVDLQWGYRTATLNTYRNTRDVTPLNNFYVGYASLHELGHARYLVDIYAWNVRQQSPHFVIDIQENGVPIAGTYVPTGLAHRTAEQGFMQEHYTYIDRYSAIALNFLAGRRAVMGNYNEPRNFGSFLNDLPAQNRLTIRDQDGTPIPDADVRIYFSVANGESWYATHYDNIPDLTLHTDAAGQVLVGRSPFATNGKVVHAYGMTNGVAIVRVATASKVAYGFLESRLFNLAYWRGQTDFADHELVVGRECSSDGPSLSGPAWDAVTGSTATLTWNALGGAGLYRVYASSNLGKPQLLAATTGTQVTVPVSGRLYWWVEAEVGVCGQRRSQVGRLNAPAAEPPLPSRRRAARH